MKELAACYPFVCNVCAVRICLFVFLPDVITRQYFFILVLCGHFLYLYLLNWLVGTIKKKRSSFVTENLVIQN